MFQIKKQIATLYLASVLGNLSLTGAWVAILAARGYGLVEIGFAETVFHITSLIFEIPSGALADVFGRKKMMMVSSVMKIIGNIIMIASRDLFMVCGALGFYALSYNFASGSDDALAYDSLKMAGREKEYEAYASRQMMIYRLCGGLSTLCAGFALFLGYRAAYGADLLMGAVQIRVLTSLYEVEVRDGGEGAGIGSAGRAGFGFLGRALTGCFAESFSFLKTARRALALMFCNSLVGAVDILLLFFLQAKLPKADMPGWALGFALFFMELGGVLGAKLILKCGALRYRTIFALGAALVLGGVAAEHSGQYLVMTAGGFLAALGDDALQVRTNALLQEMFPSEQRATLISIESFTFSAVMIVLSPLAGVLFSRW